MNILVTGAAGYIGSVCAEVLLYRGIGVIAVDNLSEGHRAAVPPSALFHQAELADGTALDSLFSQHKIDAVMHFAGEALVAKSMDEPSSFYLGNVACGVMLLDAMTRHNVKNLIFSSTCAVYGEPTILPIPEDHPKSPVNPYGQSKLRFESILADYARYTGLRYISLRYFNAAGASRERGEAHRHETHLIPRLLDAAFGNVSQVEIFGDDYPTPDGTCVRDYVHVLDIAAAHLRVLECLDRVQNRAFNVGTGRGHSILEVLDIARRVTGKPLLHKVFPRRAGDPAALVACGKSLQTELGWVPQCSSLQEIIRSAWDWKVRHPTGYSQQGALRKTTQLIR